jgi:hypothetical protein
VEITEVDGHLYGWTAADSEAPNRGCVFDVDGSTGQLPVDFGELDPTIATVGMRASVLNRLGVAVVLMLATGCGKPYEPQLLKVDDCGSLVKITEVDGHLHGWTETDPEAPIRGCVFDVNGWTGELRVDRHAEPEAFEDKVGADWLARGADLLAHTQLFHESGTFIGVVVESDHPFGVRGWGPQFDVSVLDELTEGDEAVRWTRRVTAPNEQISSLADVAANGERVSILAREETNRTYWLASLAADDGELSWTVPVDFGELDPEVAIVGMRAKDDGVVIAAFSFDTQWKKVMVGAVAVSGAGEQSIVGKREILVPQVDVVEPAANGRVWLAGWYDEGTWVTSVGLR